MGIVEIIVILAVALIVIPPENLPEVMRAAGKILRELRLASNMVVRELSGALDPPAESQPPPINTMRPDATATATNIAQTGAPADIAPPASAATPTSALPEAPDASAGAASAPAAATPAAAGPKAAV